MRMHAVLATVVALVCSTPTMAELLYYEPFLTGSNPAAGEYTVGLLDPTIDPSDGQNPIVGPTPFLTGPWEVTGALAINASVQEAGLSFLGAPALGGSQVSTPDADPLRHLSSPWTETTAGTFYISFIVNYGAGFYDDGVQPNDLGYRSVEFYNSGNTFLFGISYNQFNSPFGREPNTAPMHLDGFGQFQLLQGAPVSFAEDEINHLVVLKFDLSAAAASDSLSVYLDPTELEEPVIPNASVFGIDVTLGAIGGVTIFGGSGLGPVVDELRVADSFLEAVPAFPRKGNTNPGTGPGQDDFVDIIDYQVIVSHMNLTGQTIANGDVTGDGRVDLHDLRLWRDNRTDLTGGSTSDLDVPEPGTVILLAVVMTLWPPRRFAR